MLASRKAFLKRRKLPEPSDIAKLSIYLREQLKSFKYCHTYSSYYSGMTLTKARLAGLNRKRPVDLHTGNLQ